MRPRRSGRFALLLWIPSVGCLIAAMLVAPDPGRAREEGRRAARRPPASARVCAAATAPRALPTPLPRPVVVPAPAAPSTAVEPAPRRERPPVPPLRPGLVPRRPVASGTARTTTATPTIDDPRVRTLSRIYAARRSHAVSGGSADPRLAPSGTMPEDWNDPQLAMPGDDERDEQGDHADHDQGDGW